MAGDDKALTPAQKRGLILFNQKARCGVCHSGPLFTDSSFRVQGVAQIGPGQALSTTNFSTPKPSGADRGRFLTSGANKDLFAFRVVTLRQVATTAPYMHDGALLTLEEVIDFYDRGGADEESIAAERIDPELVPLGLDNQEKADLKAFLEALTDSLVHVTIPTTVPSGFAPVGLELQQEGMALSQGHTALSNVLAFSVATLDNFPNPFNAETQIRYTLPVAGAIEVVVFNVLGQPVRFLFVGERAAGSYQASWDGRDQTGHEMGTGIYIVAIRTAAGLATHRLLLVR